MPALEAITVEVVRGLELLRLARHAKEDRCAGRDP